MPDYELGCFYLIIGDMTYNTVTQFREHITGVFRGTDAGNVTEEVLTGFKLNPGVHEKLQLRDN